MFLLYHDYSFWNEKEMKIKEKKKRITKHIKVLWIMKTIEVEKKQQIMNFVFILKFYKKAINDLVYSFYWL